MTLNPLDLEFPQNVAQVLKGALKMIDPDTSQLEGIRIFGRPLNNTDATMSLSVVPVNWTPDPNSKEMVGSQREGIFQDYTVAIQGMVIEADEETGIILAGKLASRIRDTLYRDPALAVVLREVSYTYDHTSLGRPPTTENVIKWDVVRQNFVNNLNEMGYFVFLSETEFTFRTQIT